MTEPTTDYEELARKLDLLLDWNWTARSPARTRIVVRAAAAIRELMAERDEWKASSTRYREAWEALATGEKK